MDRRLISAYDAMTMPDACSRRIEAALTAQEQPRKERQDSEVILKAPQNQWRRTLAQVCFAVFLMVIGVTLFVKSMEGQYAQPSNIPALAQPTTETTAPEETTATSLEEETAAFLETMCHVMPDWNGYASLDDAFWTEFVVRTLNEFGEAADWTVLTPAGEANFINSMVQMDRDALDAYTKEIMGIDLPEFTPLGSFADQISYADGVYTVNVTELERLHYRSCMEPGALEEFCRTDGEWGEFTFDVYEDQSKDVIGSVRLLLYSGENEAGFTISGKVTETPIAQVENAEVQEIAMTFAKAYFLNDTETMMQYMTSREDWTIAMNQNIPDMINAWDDSYFAEHLREARVYDINGEDWEGGIEVYVDYPPRDEAWASLEVLILKMLETDEGWKVRSWEYGNPYSYDDDARQIYAIAYTAADGYLSGHDYWAERYMIGESQEPPVYQGAGEEPVVQKIIVDHKLRAPVGQAYVEFKASRDAKETEFLKLTMRKTEDGWKVETLTEGH